MFQATVINSSAQRASSMWTMPSGEALNDAESIIFEMMSCYADGAWSCYSFVNANIVVLFWDPLEDTEVVGAVGKAMVDMGGDEMTEEVRKFLGILEQSVFCCSFCGEVNNVEDGVNEACCEGCFFSIFLTKEQGM